MIYYVNTYNWLHRTKKTFISLVDVRAHIKDIVSKCKYALSDEQIEESVLVLKLDPEVIPEYEKIFRITYKTREPWSSEEKMMTERQVKHEENEIKNFRKPLKVGSIKAKDYVTLSK